MFLDDLFSPIFEQMENLYAFMHANLFFGMILFLILCIVIINLPLPITYLLKLVAGFAYGVVAGTIIGLFGFMLACMIGFWLSRNLFRNKIEEKYSKRLEKLDNEIEKNGFYYFLTLRLLLIVPHFVTNTLAGMSKVSYKKFYSSTFLGLLPEGIVYAYAGSKLAKLTHDPTSVYTGEIMSALLLIAMVGLIPSAMKIFQNYKKSKASGN